MNKYHLIALVIASILLIGLYFIFNGKKQEASVEASPQTPIIEHTDKVEPTQVEELKLTPEQLKQYYQTYEDPFVLHIRKALTGYLNGTNEGISAPEVVIKSNKLDDGPAGLDSFDKNYYKSKFIVYAINDALAGGKMINIIFQDKPDKLFNAWVYRLADADGNYDLRGFWENTAFNEGKMATIRIIYKKYLEDKKHAL